MQMFNNKSLIVILMAMIIPEIVFADSMGFNKLYSISSNKLLYGFCGVPVFFDLLLPKTDNTVGIYTRITRIAVAAGVGFICVFLTLKFFR